MVISVMLAAGAGVNSAKAARRYVVTVT